MVATIKIIKLNIFRIIGYLGVSITNRLDETPKMAKNR